MSLGDGWSRGPVKHTFRAGGQPPQLRSHNFSDALVSGGEFICDLTELHPYWAPLIEADALRLVAKTAGLRTPSPFSPATPLVITAIDAQPLEAQQALVERAAERFANHDEHGSNQRSLAAVSHSQTRSGYAKPNFTARLHTIRSIIDAYPEGHLAQGLTRPLDRSAAVRAEAARARSSTPTPVPPADTQNTGHMANAGTHNEVRSPRR